MRCCSAQNRLYARPMDLSAAARTIRPYLAKCSDVPLSGGNATTVAHVEEMLTAIESGVVCGEKGHRWLGWAQALICCRGGATLDELKQANFQA